MDVNNRFQMVQDQLTSHGADAVIITYLPHIRWICGFTGSRALLLITLTEAHFVTDTRYTEQTRQEVQKANLHISPGALHDVVYKRQLLSNTSKVLFQPEYMSVQTYHAWQNMFSHIEWTAVGRLLTDLVAVKSSLARSCMKQAQSITDKVFEEILGFIQPGMQERLIAAEIDYRHRRLGANAMAFETIVASGPNSARPHARPSSRTVQAGDFVVLDFGCVYDGYVSDMTRTVCIGSPSDMMRHIYSTVRDAQECAINRVHAGVEARQVDLAARQTIRDAGYGSNFAHSTGHGLGFEVHEWPRISEKSSDILPLGCTITIEPGIYLEGQFGVRIEDTVVVEEDRCERLPKACSDLICL